MVIPSHLPQLLQVDISIVVFVQHSDQVLDLCLPTNVLQCSQGCLQLSRCDYITPVK